MRFMVHSKYNRDTDNPIYVYFDEDTQSFDEVIIPREDSYSYFLQRGMTIEEAHTLMKSTNPDGLERVVFMDYVTKYNLFTKQDERLLKVSMSKALDVKKHRFETCHEGHIPRVTRHMIDEKLYMGMPYNKFNQLMVPTLDPKHIKALTDDGYPEDFVKQMLEMMFTEVPKMNTVSFDIETETFGTMRPNVMYSSTPIISAAFKFHNKDGNPRPGLIFVLSNDLRRLKNKASNPILNELLISGAVEMVVFDTEQAMIKAIFKIIDDPKYPLLLTYYGEGFDLPYLYNRAVNLGINPRTIPFTAWKGPDRGFVTNAVGTPWRIKMKNKMHIDMQQFFALPTIKNYVFSGKYTRLGLDFVAEGLLGRKKIELDTSINDLSIAELAYYNYIDADLTLEIMRIGDFLPLRIIFMFMRLGRQSYYDAAHRAIGNKILNFIQGYLSERNILIPNQHDLSNIGVVHSKADIKGRGYKGAIVITCVKGIYRKMKILDFGSLYPSMMKTHNISFDTINCGHPECKSNKVPELPHYICTKKIGILPTLIGCIKDIRLHMFKPWKSDPSISEKDRTAYKSVEQAIKVYVNASYGVFGNHSFGMKCPCVAESITAWSRDAITQIVIKAEELHGNDLVACAVEHGIDPEFALDALEFIPPHERVTYYGDTDSGFFKGLTEDECQTLIDYSINELGVILEPEDEISIILLYKKKNYIKVTTDGSIIVKGMLGKKRNTPPISVQCFNEFKELLKRAATNEITIDHVREETIKIIRKYYDKIWSKDADIEDFSFAMQMSKPISMYKSRVQHVTAAKKLAEHIRSQSVALKNTSDDAIIPAGSLIRYVKRAIGKIKKIKPGKKVSNVRCDPIPVEIATKDDITPLYYHSNLLSVMGQVMEALNIEQIDVMTNNPEQTSLEDYM